MAANLAKQRADFIISASNFIFKPIAASARAILAGDRTDRARCKTELFDRSTYQKKSERIEPSQSDRNL